MYAYSTAAALIFGGISPAIVEFLIKIDQYIIAVRYKLILTFHVDKPSHFVSFNYFMVGYQNSGTLSLLAHTYVHLISH